MKLSDFLNTLIKEANIEDVEAYKEVLEASKELELPKEFNDSFNSTYFTVATAKNNENIKDHYVGMTLNMQDNIVDKLIKDLGIEIDLSSYVKDTSGRTKSAFKSIKEAFAEKPQSTDNSEDVKKYTDKINELQGQMQANEDSYDIDRKKLLSEFDSKAITYSISDKIARLNLSDKYDLEDVKELILSRYRKSKYLIKKIDSETKVFDKTDPTLEATKDNKILSFDDVINEFAQPYIKQSDTTDTTTTVEPVNPSNKGTANNPYIFGGYAQK